MSFDETFMMHRNLKRLEQMFLLATEKFNGFDLCSDGYAF